ncbi:MAG: hypothetical protein ACW963_05995 [Candidatus Sifarchaeia archaeon]|jgi:hypothetical protein
MTNKHAFMDYCEICKKSISYQFRKDQLLRKSSDLYSGVFLHKCKDTKETHAILAFFDNDYAHRGTESSKVIQTDGVSLDFVQKGKASSIGEKLSLKKDIKRFYEWLINEYIFYFKTRNIPANKRVNSTLITFLASKRVNPILSKILENLRKVNPLYEKIVFLDKANSLIATTFQDEDLQNINENDLKKIYQTFFDHIKTDFYRFNKIEALETSRKLGIEMVNRWGEIARLELPEDMFQVIEVES